MNLTNNLTKIWPHLFGVCVWGGVLKSMDIRFPLCLSPEATQSCIFEIRVSLVPKERYILCFRKHLFKRVKTGLAKLKRMKRVPEGGVPPQDASPRLGMERGPGFWPTGALLRHILGQERHL
uniref:Uncharacterized protein n=1 Tax=Myotis myotis TaxID=51298 RepID=A0A7J7WHI5_MYOMY|nr:hypothetical protein mMyoMyo1_012008 [Myotis myotis]